MILAFHLFFTGTTILLLFISDAIFVSVIITELNEIATRSRQSIFRMASNAIKQYQNFRFCPRRSLKLKCSYVTNFNYYNDNLKLKLHTKRNNELFAFQEVNYCLDVYAAIVHSIKLMMFSFQHNEGNDAEK